MAPARPFWKGYLKLSLVSCPIALFPASSSSERVSFRQISKKTGHRLKQQLVDSVTGDVVESGDKGRGYQIGKDEYLPVMLGERRHGFVDELPQVTLAVHVVWPRAGILELKGEQRSDLGRSLRRGARARVVSLSRRRGRAKRSLSGTPDPAPHRPDRASNGLA